MPNTLIPANQWRGIVRSVNNQVFNQMYRPIVKRNIILERVTNGR